MASLTLRAGGQHEGVCILATVLSELLTKFFPQKAALVETLNALAAEVADEVGGSIENTSIAFTTGLAMSPSQRACAITGDCAQTIRETVNFLRANTDIHGAVLDQLSRASTLLELQRGKFES